MFDAHPPFQIDGNFGGAAGMVEMLLQSHNGVIAMLPALPSAWPDGSIQGLRARGGLQLSISWRGGAAESAVIQAAHDGEFRLRPPPGQRITQVEAAGQPVAWENGDDATVKVRFAAGQTYRLGFQ
jgi:alpha-L-fucosidase 2